jgi:hypothetical protein
MKNLSLFLTTCTLIIYSCSGKDDLLSSLKVQKKNISDSIKYYADLSDSYILKSQNDSDEESIIEFQDSSILYFNKHFALEKKLEKLNFSIDSLEKNK